MLDDIGLSQRTYGALIRYGITSIYELRKLSIDKLKLIPGIGSSSIVEIDRALRPDKEGSPRSSGSRLRFLEASIRWHRLKADAMEAELELLKIDIASRSEMK